MKKCFALFFVIIILATILIGCGKGGKAPVASGGEQSTLSSKIEGTTSLNTITSGIGTDDGEFNLDEGTSSTSKPIITTSTVTSGTNSANSESSQSSQTSSSLGGTSSNTPAQGEFNTNNKENFERVPA